MKKLLTLALLLSSPAFAGEKLQMVAVPHEKTPSAKLDRESKAIRKSHLVDHIRPVFNSSESKALGKLGDPALGRSMILEFSSSKHRAKFEAWAKTHLASFKLEEDPVVHKTEASLGALQWALNNTGGSYSVPVDDMSTKKIPAVAGEDIDLGKTPPAIKKITVAVLDTGIDVTNPDLQGAIVQHTAECDAQKQYTACRSKAGNTNCDAQFNIDHDGNGYPLDCNGWNLAAANNGKTIASGALPKTQGILGNTLITDLDGHGTHVAGIIAAQGIVVNGVAQQAQILPVRVISGSPNELIQAQSLSNGLPAPQETGLGVGTGLGDIVARGVLYAVRSGAQIINMSLGWPDPLDSDLLRRILKIAQQQGVMIVAAAGNDSTDSPIFPCRYDGVVCVGAMTPDGSLAFFSDYGHDVDVLAPGWSILSTYPLAIPPIDFTNQAGYEEKDGTSMAAPFVSGMLARMLGSGMSADEAYARLILGARETRPSQVEDPKIFSNISLSGNADLSASYQVQPQPLVLPSRKDMVRAAWDRHSLSVPIQFFLEDHWRAASNVHIEIKPDANTGGVKLTTSSWNISNWNPLEEKAFNTELTFQDTRVNSELDFDIEISGSGMKTRTASIRVEVYGPIGVTTQTGSQLTSLPLVSSTGQSLSRNYDEIHSVSIDFGTGQEYLGVYKNGSNRVLDLLATRRGKVVLVGSSSAADAGNTVLSLRKILDPQSGAVQYALVEGQPQSGGVSQAPQAQFTFYDASFQPIAGKAAEVVDAKTTYLSQDDFQWQLLQNQYVPTWYGLGLLPTANQEPYNPWNPTTNTAPGFYMYYLASDGLHSVDLPTNYPEMISMIPQTPAQRQAGVIAALLATGDDYNLSYATAELVQGKWQNVQAITFPQYHYLRGIVASAGISLDPSTSYAGTAFSGYVDSDSGPKGSRRTTLITPPSVQDITAYPLRNFDAVADVTGTYQGPKRAGQFVLTKYEIQYLDITHGKSAMTNQKRFSFLPDILAIKGFFPTVVEDKDLEKATGEPRVAAIFVPGDFINSKDTEVVVPVFDHSGNLETVQRPAMFHLESEGNCTALATPNPSGTGGPAEFLFFCGDRFLSAPLSY